MSVVERVALLGYGEVGQILADDLHARGIRQIAVWDTLFRDQGSLPSRVLASDTVRAANSAADACAGAQMVISAVTPAQALVAAQAAAGGMQSNVWFLDLNSVSPQTKRDAAGLIEARGAHYVEAAVMSPIISKRSATSILLGGPHAAVFEAIAASIGLTGAQFFSFELGQPSAVKMCRSVLVKGLEALLAESLLSAHSYGVAQSVLDSLRELFPHSNWQRTARHMLSRSVLHGRRCAEEMDEVVQTLSAVGIEPWMSVACAKRQGLASAHAAAAERKSLEGVLDAMLAGGNGRG